MGAWIETPFLLVATNNGIVASYVGAWIETKPNLSNSGIAKSRPTWARGLKLNALNVNSTVLVASYVGAWIETLRVRDN